jgi:hypothetical protein
MSVSLLGMAAHTNLSNFLAKKELSLNGVYSPPGLAKKGD